MPRSTTKASLAPPRQKPYHHGNLRQSLLEAALELAQESGPDHVSVREVARRIGVSSGAPFRHFDSRTALMTALAEQAMGLFRAEIEAGQKRTPDDPVSRLRALGHAFIHWAFLHPTHFQIISSRHLIDFAGSATLGRDLNAVRALTVELLGQLPGMGARSTGALREFALLARATVYGLARMRVDGQFPEWDIEDSDALPAALASVDLLITVLQAP